jgi:hypothetical protein
VLNDDIVSQGWVLSPMIIWRSSLIPEGDFRAPRQYGKYYGNPGKVIFK